MSNKLDHTPRKSPRLVETTSTNILTQSQPSNKNESLAQYFTKVESCYTKGEEGLRKEN